MTQKTRKSATLFRILISLIIIATAAVASLLYIVVAPNIRLNDDQESAYLYIYDNYTFEEVVEQLKESELMQNTGTFTVLAKVLNYDKRVRPGKYLLTEGMSNLMLLRNLRNGKQEPVKLIINNIRTKEQLAAFLSESLMPDSASIIRLLNNDSLLAEYGLNQHTAVCLFIPNTYELYWDTDTMELAARMYKEYMRFWTEERRAKAASIPLSETEVMTLASIVEEETNKRHEYPVIAGLYLNRLRIGMPLQADPTVRFAINDFTLRRILFGHLKFESPYNTYRNKGLPPGPIRLPSITCIDAVLNYEEHDFLFMVAKETLNGEHTFARNGAEHMRNARKYQQALNNRGIR